MDTKFIQTKLIDIEFTQCICFDNKPFIQFLSYVRNFLQLVHAIKTSQTKTISHNHFSQSAAYSRNTFQFCCICLIQIDDSPFFVFFLYDEQRVFRKDTMLHCIALSESFADYNIRLQCLKCLFFQSIYTGKSFRRTEHSTFFTIAQDISGYKSRQAQLTEKLSAGTGGLVPSGAHMLIDLASWYKSSLPPKIELIQSAIQQHRTIRFTYFSPKGESVRTVEPYYQVFHWSTWYVWGWCRMRKDFRLFKLNRMTNLTASEPFAPRCAPLPDLEPERVFPVKYQVTVLFDPVCRWRLVEEYGADCFIVEPDGRLRFTGGFPDEDSVLGWVLTFGDKAELVEPEELRDRLGALVRALADRYRRD